jgi:hypothetical protein
LSAESRRLDAGREDEEVAAHLRAVVTLDTLELMTANIFRVPSLGLNFFLFPRLPLDTGTRILHLSGIRWMKGIEILYLGMKFCVWVRITHILYLGMNFVPGY